MTTHYRTLNVTRYSTKDDVRSAYIRLAKAEHPDIVAKATDKFIEAHEAYKVLCNPQQRAQYNAWLDECFVVCAGCKGRGVKVKQITLKERQIRPCLECHGAGVGEKK